jgi:hypothetical protein
MVGRSRAALVAQLDRASDFESEGREFESLRARQCFRDGTPRTVGKRRDDSFLRLRPPCKSLHWLTLLAVLLRLLGSTAP